MKTRFNSIALAAALCGFAFTMPGPSLMARENEVEVRQEIERVVALASAANAPTNALGLAKLEVGHRGGTNRIEIHTFGLLPGVYTVTVFDRAGVSSAVLGTISTTAAGNDDSLKRGRDDGGDDTNDDSGGNRNRRRGGGDDDGEGEAEFPMPASITAFDLGRISVTDNTGAEVLAGDFGDVSSTVSGRFVVTVPAVAGASDDDASGVASIRAHMRRGRGTGSFSLNAGNLPPSTTVTVVINGEDAGTARTDRRGRLRVRRTHKTLDLFSVSAVSVRDDSGGEVLKADF